MAATDSTNNQAKKAAFQTLTTKIFLTDHQTAGRGRGNNNWLDSCNEQLLSSWLFSLNQPPQPVLSPLVGLALYNSLKKIFPQAMWSIKAPNDIYLNDKKIAGLLLETVAQGNKFCLIVGLGLNVLSSPSDIENSIPLSWLSDFNQISWTDFLDCFYLSLSTQVQRNPSQINAIQQQELLYALNQWPQLSEKYLQVEVDGTLQSAKGKLPWSSL